MGLFKAGNPAFNEKTISKITYESGQELMTANGAIKKFGLMLVMLLGAASFTWSAFYQGVNVLPWAMGASIAGFVVALVIIFKKSWAPYLALGYALLQGLFLGAISAVFEAAFADKYPGIVMQAVMLTFGVAIGMFALYYFRIVQATETFKKVVIGATIGIALFYLVALVMNLFGAQMPYLHSNGLVGIGISVFVVVVAALNLILDFDLIEQGAAHGAPKYFEWYCAFGLLVTIVWLYLEILKLLSKLASRK
ncbi:Bax inhibitor-1/YccA family protein [Flavisolibacter nicotianae]|uniref:Bax inhibitor-1/YccA family protein n=1 Tax=Flavisolibacter nicotianae TaxID=2364882 RepID=UPI000EB2D8DC|nr:Bax inhibitor-1/YccA family protein [Flavisolibacter nicotianae]